MFLNPPDIKVHKTTVPGILPSSRRLKIRNRAICTHQAKWKSIYCPTLVSGFISKMKTDFKWDDIITKII